MNLKYKLYILSGVDKDIVNKCDPNIQNRFTAISTFVLMIYVLCIVSSFYAFKTLFQSFFIGIMMSLFFSWMIINIYMLLLYTLSKNSFPSDGNNKSRLSSIIIRVLFISFIAIIVSKPIEVIIFSPFLKNDIAQYKIQQIEKYTTSTNKYFNDEMKSIQEIIQKQQEIYTNSKISQISEYKKLIKKRNIKKEELVSSMTKLVMGSNYFIQSIEILSSKYKITWLITIFTVLIFLLPGYLKFSLSEDDTYYQEKKGIDLKLVIDEYSSFRYHYSQIFKNQFSKDIQFSEAYINPPFNTLRKKDKRTFFSEDDLIKDLYES